MEIQVNGKSYKLDVSGNRSLLSVLRDELDLTGAKYGCGEGQCGACTVLINGQSARSCMTTVGSVAGKQITTIEGLEKDGRLHPVQAAFLEVGVMQCGFCTPGMVMSAVALLRRNPHPTTQDIVRFMEGNVCRCGTYPRIVEAIRRAAGQEAKA